MHRYATTREAGSRYFFHLSDLHYGVAGVEAAEKRLLTLIEEQMLTLDPQDRIDFIITGDAVDSPSKRNNRKFREFTDYLEWLSDSEPLFVIGNHDVNRLGIALFPSNQILANHLGGYPKLVMFEDIQTIFILFNSNRAGFLASGEIGHEQMAKVDRKLRRIANLEEYTLVALLHHHVTPVESLSTSAKWYKAFLPKSFREGTVHLRDADAFLDFLSRRKVNLVLHGHKHVPFISKRDDIYIVACGSSTRREAHNHLEDTCLNYNLLKFDETSISCTQLADDHETTTPRVIRSIVIDR